MQKTGQMLMSRCQAKGKGEDEEGHEGCDDDGRVLIFVYFHADSPIILIIFTNPFFEHFGSAGHEHINQQPCTHQWGDEEHGEATLNDYISETYGEAAKHGHGCCENTKGNYPRFSFDKRVDEEAPDKSTQPVYKLRHSIH